jgi:acetyl-CoA carboxylase carboxyl transferase subunit beta
MAWFKREAAGLEASGERIIKSEGLWFKCDGCRHIMWKKDFEANYEVCTKCDKHFRIDTKTRLAQLFDDATWTEEDGTIETTDPLEFTDLKPYKGRVKAAQKKTGRKDAIVNARGKIEGREVLITAIEYNFIGGSMGGVVGETITRAVEKALAARVPLIAISATGGARMMEGTISLMTMAKISAALAKLDDAKIPYISVLTDPTTGGVTASFAMLGDLNIGEPGALIGFAGPRVIEQTIRQKLPPGFQRSEFLLQKGFLDAVVHRREMKDYLARAFDWMTGTPREAAAS